MSFVKDNVKPDNYSEDISPTGKQNFENHVKVGSLDSVGQSIQKYDTDSGSTQTEKQRATEKDGVDSEINTFKDSANIADRLFNIYRDEHIYGNFGDIVEPTRGLHPDTIAKLNDKNNGEKNISILNKLHLIKLAGNYPSKEIDIPKHKDFFEPKTVIDLCQMNQKEDAVRYDIDDFVYCKNVGLPINRLVTLRRFPFPCTDNIFDKQQEWHDMARMVTYMTQDTNKMEDLLSFSYALRWKELTAEMEQASMFGDQSGVSGFMKKVATLFDTQLQKNTVDGRSSGGPMSQYDPKFDQNRVYGPVDSISQTTIRDVGLEFTKDFEVTFDYELRSINGRTAEYAFKDIIANVLACTYNNGKFWGGSRYWVGERPTNFMRKIAYMNSDNAWDILHRATKDLKAAATSLFGTKQKALDTLKRLVNGAFAVAMGKILDSVGRPGILAMNSLLSSEPTGNWHLTIGNPFNPIMAIGNLIMTGVDFKFPTDSLSYGDFPNKMQIIVKLKPAQPKDRAGIEMMFNHGRQRIYYTPKGAKSLYLKHARNENRDFAAIIGKNNGGEPIRNFFGMEENALDTMLYETHDFLSRETIETLAHTAFESGKAENKALNKYTGTRDSGPAPASNDTGDSES